MPWFSTIFEDARNCLAFYRDAPEPTHVQTRSYRLAGEARLAAHEGRSEAAAALAARAVEIAETTDELNLRASIWLSAAEVRRAGGKDAEAEDAIAAAPQPYDEKENITAAAVI